MAEAPFPNPKVIDSGLEDLEKDIMCAVCHNHYQKARFLPCHHYFCASCIETLLKHSRNETFGCPECHKTTSLPPGGVSKLPAAFFVERMKDVYGKMALVDRMATRAVCEQCTGGGKAAGFCRQCAEFICEDCMCTHRSLKIFAWHKLVTLVDLQACKTKSIFVKDDETSNCPEHDEEMKIFCFDCNRFVCRDCMLYDHCNHKTSFVKKCASDTRKKLHDFLITLRGVQVDITEAEKVLHEQKIIVKSKVMNVKEFIQVSYDHLKALLDHHKINLEEKASTLGKSREDALTGQIQQLKIAQSDIQGHIEFTEQTLIDASDKKLVHIQPQLETKMEEGERWQVTVSEFLQPTSTQDIYYFPPVNETLFNLGAVFTENTASASIAGLANVCKIGETTQFHVKIADSVHCSLQVHLKSLVDPNCTVQGVVSSCVDKGSYIVRYTPRVRGRHDVAVKVNHQEIIGSPFRVSVTLHPTMLGRPVRKIKTYVSKSWGITVNNEQQLVVVSEKKITVMDQDGREVHVIECAEFQNPNGVAVSEDGAIYVIDSMVQCLFKFNKEGMLMCYTSQIFYNPVFINIFQSHIFVSDINKIEIFDLDCNIVGSMDTSAYRDPIDIGEYGGNLYMVTEERRNFDVYQYNSSQKDRIKIRHVTIKECKPSTPFCFDKNGYIYMVLSKHCSKCVQLFDLDGEYITSFGFGILQNPFDVVIDDDGFVYVCDQNGTVLVF